MHIGSPNGKDGLKNRRSLALWSALYSLVLWPNQLIILHLWLELDIGLIKALLLYITTLAGLP